MTFFIRVLLIASLGVFLGCTEIPEYRYEFPESACENYNANESNSAITVCRSQIRENRFLLIANGFAHEPETIKQDALELVDLLFLILPVMQEWKDRPSGAHSQDESRWERAAGEYVRNRYGSNAGIGRYMVYSVGGGSNLPPLYTFDAIPNGQSPPWGDWFLRQPASKKIYTVPLEVLDE